jgi:mRNA interferase HigB
MRVISKKTMVNFYAIHSTSKASLEAFHQELKKAKWSKHSELKERYPSADLIAGNRYVFNIKGNDFRLVAEINFKKQLAFIIWIGTHAEYTKLDVKKVNYVKSD